MAFTHSPIDPLSRPDGAVPDGVGLDDEHPASTAMARMVSKPSALFTGTASSCLSGGVWHLIFAP